jgi:hypothetical protein
MRTSEKHIDTPPLLLEPVLLRIPYCTVSAVLVRLQNAPLCWIHRFIADSTSRHYNLSLLEF